MVVDVEKLWESLDHCITKMTRRVVGRSRSSHRSAPPPPKDFDEDVSSHATIIENILDFMELNEVNKMLKFSFFLLEGRTLI